MEITEALGKLLNETKANLSGYQRRHFMAETVKTICAGSATQAERTLGWNRSTLHKALAELEGGFCYIDQGHRRGRKKAESHLPQLLDDICEIAEQCSQTDPTFRTTQLYTRLTAREVRRQLMQQKAYTEEALPCVETIRLKLNQLGYKLRPVKKLNP